jgi:hypothetical protein
VQEHEQLVNTVRQGIARDEPGVREHETEQRAIARDVPGVREYETELRADADDNGKSHYSRDNFINSAQRTKELDPDDHAHAGLKNLSRANSPSRAINCNYSSNNKYLRPNLFYLLKSQWVAVKIRLNHLSRI